MKLRDQLTAGALILFTLGAVLVYKGWYKALIIDAKAPDLAYNETSKVTVTPSTIVHTTRDRLSGETHTKINTNYGHGYTVTTRTDGTTIVRSKDLGFGNDFALSTDFKSIGIADEFFYYKSLSLVGGSHFISLRDSRLQMNLFVGLGYRLPVAKLNNVSAFVGFDTDRRAVLGLYLRLGNS